MYLGAKSVEVDQSSRIIVPLRWIDERPQPGADDSGLEILQFFLAGTALRFAKLAVAEARRFNPQLTIKWFLENWPVPPMIVEGLGKAGLPEE